MNLNLKYKPDWTLVSLFLLVLISRIPFLFCGYGAEEDSWGTPLAIWQTLHSGIYEPSRLPGHPVPEFLYLLLPYASPFWWNLLAAIACAFASVAFYKIINKLDLQAAYLSALALAFVPVIFISSTYTIDYCFTLAFVLWSFYFLIESSFLWAALFLGLAIGSRITSGIFLLPFLSWILTINRDKTEIKSTVNLVMLSLIIGTICYLPLLQSYGYRFFQYYDQFPYPSWEKVLFKATFGVWGVIGLLGILSACISQTLFIGFSKLEIQTKKNKVMVGLAILITLLYTFSYLRLPQKSGYWIPAIPFIILALNVGLLEMLYKFVLLCLMVSSFIFGLGLTDANRGSKHSNWAKVYKIRDQELFFDPATGPLYSDFTKRHNKESFCKEVATTLDQPEYATSIIICGWWYNELMVYALNNNPKLVPHLRFYLTESELVSLSEKGVSLYFLPEQDKYNDLYTQISLTNHYALAWENLTQHER
ncbi:MAG: glycosyltransferase family 39 protein [Bacteroidia bacterium]|nr:glycosyltransferase family 39 protein [Bacteroidia bacterium]